MSLTSWFLVNSGGTRHRLPREMIFVGRDDCELMLQSRSVDKQHAVINYEPSTDEHKVKDLGSLNGTFVNDVRIQEQQYITLKIDDKLRFGYDTNLFTVVRGELHVPEEALRHEKFSSQLQIAKKPSSTVDSYRNSETAGAEGGKEAAVKLPEPSLKREEKVTAGDVAVLPRGTPLYGQPSWWGDADDENLEKHDTKASDPRQFKCEPGSNIIVKPQEVPATVAQMSTAQEPSYFEIPSKEAISLESTSENFPLTEEGAAAISTDHVPEGSTHGHASFTIEFNTVASSKGTERSTKGGQGHRSRPKRETGEELNALQAAMVAAEVKVADWLAQNDLPLALTESLPDDDGDSVKSDVPVQIRSLRGSKHEDGTQSDSENALSEQLSSQAASQQDRGQSTFCSRGGLFQSKPSPFSKKMLPMENETDKEQTRNHLSPSLTIRQHGKQQEGPQRSQTDDQSDRGTYTIKLGNSNTEEDEARCIIDKVFRVEDNQALTRLRYPEHQRDKDSVWTKPGAIEPSHIDHTSLLSDDLVVVGGPRWVSQWASLAASHIRTDPEGSGAECTAIGTGEKGNSEAELPRKFNTYVSSCQSQHKQAFPPDSPENSDMDTVATEGQKFQHRYMAALSEKQDQEFQDKEGQLHGVSKARHRVAGVTQSAIDRTRVSKRTTTKSKEVRQKPKFSDQIPHTSPGGGKKSRDKKEKSREEDKKASGKPLLRQESFTVEKPSAHVPVELIPCIDGPGTTSHMDVGSISKGTGAATLLKDSEAVIAFLENSLPDQTDTPSFSLEGSVSPESDIDTTSTVSQAGGEGGSKVAQTKPSSSGQICNKSKIMSGTKVKSHPRVPNHSHSRAWASLDLTDDDLNSSIAQDTYAAQVHNRSKTVKLRTEASSSRANEAKSKTAAPAYSVSRPASMCQPRPTRASLLRRARLGDSCDTDLADMDRMSVASEASTTSSASRPSAGRRTLSRIEALAQPRRPRVSSPSARSDSEATSGRVKGFASHPGPDSTLQLGFQSSSVPRARASSTSKVPDKLAGKSFLQGTTTTGGRWRHVPVEYASTSEDEFGSNRHPTKRTQPRRIASRVIQLGGSAPATPSPGSMLRHQSSREQDEYMRDWTAHSEEIARISQDLAKDLAMLAQEIHDVAGEIDSASPSSAPSALIEGRVLVDRLSSSPDISCTAVELRPRSSSNQEPRAIRRQTWNRDEAVLDSLVLASVSQLSAKIRQGVDKTASKIRILFKDKDKKWAELESKLLMENEVPLLKTSNQEISSILKDLKQVERQLLVIDIMLDPDGTLDALTNLGITSPLVTEIRVSPGAQNQSGSHRDGEGSASTPMFFSAEQDLGLMTKVQSNTIQK
ncbi:centrosomal protein of 170 kDa isoform X3 [Pygocentrus nattereri]|uniref:centrosomal protein of 170 kDa isoform X3 n=1 Tax=Pygocentrus nattereri TaxID=42514 RepID=UPI0008148139|nr:centrosomal protein of 170 kDa isoform X3 [Pygocentrus nattereri]